ncbi:hypothetical protein [Lacticaseibacillus sp. GG6-2]
MREISATSRCWLAFFGLIQCVLVVVFATALGFTLTIGTPKRVTAELTRGQSRAALTTALNHQLVKDAQAGGLMLPAHTTLVTEAQTATLVRQTVAAGADFKREVAVQPTIAVAQRRARQVAREHHLTPDSAQWRVIDASIQTGLTKTMTDLMQTGVGVAYGMVVLIFQTMTIVAAILMVITMGLMGLTAHSFRRWLRVNGRILYGIGFLGGVGALLAGVPALSATWRLAKSPVGIVSQLMQAFAPTWQHVAGGVVLVGLLLAGTAYLFRNNSKKYKISS